MGGLRLFRFTHRVPMPRGRPVVDLPKEARFTRIGWDHMSDPTLTEFLLACIADREALAIAVRDARPSTGLSDSAWQVAALDEPLCSFVLDNSPNRVLAECEAKRRIVTSFAAGAAEVRRGTGEWAVTWMVLRLLALPYADHPDYRAEWKP